ELSLRQTLDAGDVTGIGAGYARHGDIEPFDRDLHMMSIGVDHAFRVEHDPYMSAPEDEITATERGEVDRLRQGFAKRCLLHIGIAQGGNARALKRHLHNARAIEAEAVAPAPQIRYAGKFFGH